MLRLIISLLILAVIAGVLGFTGIAAAAAGIAKVVFWLALVSFLISIIFSLLRRAKL